MRKSSNGYMTVICAISCSTSIKFSIEAMVSKGVVIYLLSSHCSYMNFFVFLPSTWMTKTHFLEQGFQAVLCYAYTWQIKILFPSLSDKINYYIALHCNGFPLVMSTAVLYFIGTQNWANDVHREVEVANLHERDEDLQWKAPFLYARYFRCCIWIFALFCVDLPTAVMLHFIWVLSCVVWSAFFTPS